MNKKNIFFIGILLFSVYSLIVHTTYASSGISGLTGPAAAKFCSSIGIPNAHIQTSGVGASITVTYTCPFVTPYLSTSELSKLSGNIHPPPVPYAGNPYVSPASQVASYNQQNAAYMETCPETPPTAPTNNIYFVSGAQPFIAGDVCQLYSLGVRAIGLPSDVVYTQHYSFSLFDLAHGYSNISIENTAYMVLKDVAYSPQLESGAISTAYGSNSNIFSGAAPQPQHGLWSWVAAYADFADAPAVTKTTSSLFGVPVPSLFGTTPPAGDLLYVAPGIGYNPPAEVYPIACIYTYKYTISTTLQSIQNTQIPYVYQTAPPNGKTPGTNATFNTNFLPYIMYNFKVENPSLGNNLYTLDQLSYAAYSPFNYNNPKTSEIPINISTPQLFMVSYNTNKYQQNCNSGNTGFFGSIGCFFDRHFGSSVNSKTILVPYAMPNMVVNTMQSESIAYPNLGEPIMYGYGANQQQLATAGANTVNAMVSIKDPLSIAAIPNDYIFVLANTITVPSIKAVLPSSCTITQPSSGSNLDNFIQSTISDLGVPDTTNNEAFIAAIAQSYSNGADFVYNNPLGINPIQGKGSTQGLTVNINTPSSPCTAPDGTPEYSSPSQGATASADAIKQTVSVNGAALATYNAIMYGLQNNQPLSYYTTNSEASSELSEFPLMQSVSSSAILASAPISSTISSQISTSGSASAAASALVSWAHSITTSSQTGAQSTASFAGATNSIYVIRVMNQGYYNNSVMPPGSIPNVVDTITTSDTALGASTKPASSLCAGTVSCQTVWNTDWENYWTSLIKLQSANTYVIDQIPLTPTLIAGQLSSAKSNYNSKVGSALSQAGCTLSGLVERCIESFLTGGSGCGSQAGVCIAAKGWYSYASCWIHGNKFSSLNISADAEGDIFITGVMDTCGTNSPWIVKISNPQSGRPIITGSLLTLANGQVPKDNSGNPLVPTEISVSPDGKLIFIASQQSSNIYVFSGTTLKYLSTYNLAYSSDVAPLGITYQGAISQLSNVPGVSTSTTSPVPSVNITEFIANGGFYGLNTINNNEISTIVNKFKTAGITQLDQASYHHPVAIQDINGYLYVLDNWYGGIGQKCEIDINLYFYKNCYTHSDVANFDTLMLRVINSTGQDVPINPTTYDDVWYQTGQNSNGQETYQPYNGEQSGGIYPPFGWMISGSLSDGTSSGVVNLCGLSSTGSTCTLPPSTYSQNNNYWPLGPALNGLDCRSSAAVTVTGGQYGCAFLPLSGLGFSVSLNNTMGILFPSSQNINSGSGQTANKYAELLFTKFDLENYTQFLSPKGPPVLAQSVCYADINGKSALSLPSGDNYPNLCIKDNNVNSFESPILLLSSPFNYTENIGSLKTLTYSEYLYSTFSGAASITSSTSPTTNPSSTASQYDSLLGNSKFVNQGETIPTSTGAVSPSQVASSEQTKLESFLSGYAVVPYEATFQTQQQIQQHTMKTLPVSTTYWCFTKPVTAPPFDISRTWDTLTTIFSAGVSNNFKSPMLSAPIEGGPSYAQYLLNGTFYQQMLNATILPKQILLDLFTNRIFGTVYVNDSLAYQTNKQITVNAIRTMAYGIEYNRQGVSLSSVTKLTSIAGYPYYASIYPVTNPASIGGTSVLPCIGSVCMTQTSLSSALSSALSISGNGDKNTFTYPPSKVFPNAVTLFNFYQDMIYANETFINFTGNGIGTPGTLTDPYGYHRIVVVFNDRFNNNIYLPIDADIANATQLGVSVASSVSGSNSNQTSLTITGNLNYTPPFSTQPIPMKGGTVYLYYNTNIGFQNYNPYTDPANVQLCAFGFGANVPQNCQLAIPGWLYGGTTPNPNAEIPTYHASTSASGSCLAAPNSLLQPIQYNCNIYGTDGKTKLSATCPVNSGGNNQWCDPIFSNGTGLCTSQLGLIGSATTNANGIFSKTITACGYGYANIKAVFYGAPSAGSSSPGISTVTPEPIKVTQSPIAYAYNPSYSGPQDTFYTTDYSWAPVNSSTSFPIGALLLSYGNIGYLYILAGGIIVGLLLFATRKTGRK